MINILSSLPWSSFFLIIIALILIGVFLRQSSFYDKINKNGIEVEGIVFSVDRRMVNSFINNFNASYYYEITVRFLTKENVWVTQKNNSSWIVSYMDQYKEGEKVKVKYDPQDPSNFIVGQKAVAVFGLYTVLIVGLIFFGLGVFQIIQSL